MIRRVCICRLRERGTGDGIYCIPEWKLERSEKGPSEDLANGLPLQVPEGAVFNEHLSQGILRSQRQSNCEVKMVDICATSYW